MQGMTFHIWDRDEGGRRHRRSFTSVPNGFWVLKVEGYDAYDEAWNPGEILPVPNLLRGSQFEICGPTPQKILLEEQGEESFHGAGDVAWTYLLVGVEPFGIVKDEDGEVWFEAARQIHKGRLGRKPPLELPKIVRESEGRRHGRTTQNPAGWVRVNDVARLVGMEPHEMLLTYYDFDRNRKDLGSSDIWIEEGTPENIRQSLAPRASFPGRNGIKSDLEKIEESPDRDAWIRLGFARTILYLHLFGWKASRDRRLGQRRLISALRDAAELLKPEHPERTREVETWIAELELELL